MDPKVISSTDLRVKTRDIIESAKFEGQHYIVETFGKPMVAIIGIEEYNALKHLLRLRGETGTRAQKGREERTEDALPQGHISEGGING